MALRDDLKKKKKQCFEKIEIPEWDAGSPITIRGLSVKEQLAISSIANGSEGLESDVLRDANLKALYSTFAYCFGDEKGERVYADCEDSTLEEIKENIPFRVILIVNRKSAEFTNEVTKKN